MSQLSEIRRNSHINYLKKNVLPSVILNIKKNKNIGLLTNFVKKKYIPDVINLSKEELEMIPGLFRFRIKLSDKNLKQFNCNYGCNDSYEDDYDNYDDNYDYIDNGDYEDDYDDNMRNAINESKKMYNLNKKNYNEQIMDKVIEESLKSNGLNESFNDTSFWVCIDLRVYGPNPNKEIYVFDTPYYFDNEQIKRIKQEWYRVNPNNSSGIKLKQDINFFKNMAHDINKN